MAARPKPPDVPLELWRRALDAALAFRALAPWEWMNDSEIVALTDPTGRPWFASVLGAARQVYGLALYRNEAGLRVVQRLMAARGPEDWEELRYAQDGLTVWFGPKNELSPLQRDCYAALGYQPARGTRLAWPSILDHRPGWVPWLPEAADVVWLAEALPIVTRFAGWLQAHPGLYDDRDPFEFPLLPSQASLGDPSAVEWRLWSPGPERLRRQEIRIPDPEVAARIRALAAGRVANWDVDWTYLPDGVVDEGRPYYPRNVQIFDAHSGACLAMDLAKATENIVEKVASQMVELMLRTGGIPRVVRVRRSELFAPLQGWLAGLGGSVKQVKRLKWADEFQLGLAQFVSRI